jgi:hypothetical protein
MSESRLPGLVKEPALMRTYMACVKPIDPTETLPKLSMDESLFLKIDYHSEIPASYYMMMYRILPNYNLKQVVVSGPKGSGKSALTAHLPESQFSILDSDDFGRYLDVIEFVANRDLQSFEKIAVPLHYYALHALPQSEWFQYLLRFKIKSDVSIFKREVVRNTCSDAKQAIRKATRTQQFYRYYKAKLNDKIFGYREFTTAWLDLVNQVDTKKIIFTHTSLESNLVLSSTLSLSLEPNINTINSLALRPSQDIVADDLKIDFEAELFLHDFYRCHITDQLKLAPLLILSMYNVVPKFDHDMRYAIPPMQDVSELIPIPENLYKIWKDGKDNENQEFKYITTFFDQKNSRKVCSHFNAVDNFQNLTIKLSDLPSQVLEYYKDYLSYMQEKGGKDYAEFVNGNKLEYLHNATTHGASPVVHAEMEYSYNQLNSNKVIFYVLLQISKLISQPKSQISRKVRNILSLINDKTKVVEVLETIIPIRDQYLADIPSDYLHKVIAELRGSPSPISSMTGDSVVQDLCKMKTFMLVQRDGNGFPIWGWKRDPTTLVVSYHTYKDNMMARGPTRYNYVDKFCRKNFGQFKILTELINDGLDELVLKLCPSTPVVTISDVEFKSNILNQESFFVNWNAFSYVSDREEMVASTATQLQTNDITVTCRYPRLNPKRAIIYDGNDSLFWCGTTIFDHVTGSINLLSIQYRVSGKQGYVLSD